MEEFQKYFFYTTFHHNFQARNAKISPIFLFDRGHNGRICHILCVKDRTGDLTLDELSEICELIHFKQIIDHFAHPLNPIIKLQNPVTKASQTRSTSLTTGQFQFRKKKEKSTAILVSIVVLFVLCHSYRLCLKIYEFAMPSSHVMDTFTYCFHKQRYVTHMI